MSEDIIRKHKNKLKSLEEKRVSWLNNWRKISDYIMPRRGVFSEEPNDGNLQTSKIWDSTATVAVERLASGIHSGLTSPTRPWFKLLLFPMELMDRQSSREWFEVAEQILYNAFAHSNFYDALHEAYVELVCFGSTCLLMEDINDGTLNFRVVPAGQYYLAESANGRINTLYRKFWMQLHQIVEQFGSSALPKRLNEMAKKDPYEWERIVHCIEPNLLYNKYNKK